MTTLPRCVLCSPLNATPRGTMLQIHCYHMEMHHVNWRAFDLNLLVVFDGLMQERSVTRAGKRLGMSQPALSHALNRLRFLLKDQLFIRTPKGMVPTPRAEQLAEPLRRALAAMEHALEPETFVPAKATRRFPIAVSNYAAIVIGPPLVAAGSNMVATLSRRGAEALVGASGAALQLRDLPVTSPAVRTSMAWPRRLDGAPAHRWLRDVVTGVCQRL